MKILCVVLVAVGLTGCATFADLELPSATQGATFCQVAKPISWDPKDTRLTKEQVDTHNRIGKRMCGWGKKG